LLVCLLVHCLHPDLPSILFPCMSPVLWHVCFHVCPSVPVWLSFWLYMPACLSACLSVSLPVCLTILKFLLFWRNCIDLHVCIQVDDPLREVFQSLGCFLVDPDLGPLTKDKIGAMKDIQDAAFGDKAADKDIRLVYHLRANLAVFRRDILCMKVGGWMKDDIVNIYMALLQVTLPCHPKQLLLQ